MADPRNSGRRFERLIFLIERLRSADARVEFDARIPETISGRVRQVDVAVWVPSHHGELLIQVECRDTRRRQGVAEVEQLSSKREAIGAAQLIICSPTGFTSGAREKAQYDPRTKLLVLDEKGDADWPEWLAIEPLEVRSLRWEPIDVRVSAEPGRGGPPLGSIVTADESWKVERVFEVDSEPRSLPEIMQTWFTSSGGRKLLEQASAVVQLGTVRLSFSPGRAYVIGGGGTEEPSEIWEIAFTIEYWFDVVEVPFRLFAYTDATPDADSEIAPVWVTEPFAAFDGESRMAIAAEPGGDELRWVVGPA